MYLIELEFVNEVYLRLVCPSDAFTFISNHFKYFVENYKYHPRYRMKPRTWDGKVSLISYKDKLFPIGLLYELYQLCKKYNHTLKYNFDVTRLRSRFDDTFIDKFIIGLQKKYPSDLKPYDFQIDAIKKSIKLGRGINLLSVSSGKSLIIYYIAQFNRFSKSKTIIITPSIGLTNQLYRDFESYGWTDVGDYVSILNGETRADFSKDILITTYQSVVKKPLEFFKNYKSLIVDEAQSQKSISLQYISKRCINASTRLGFSGTLPSEEINYKTIIGILGPIISKVTTKNLQDRGIVSKLKIKNILLKYDNKFIRSNKNRPYNEEVKEVLSNSNRNKVLDYIIKSSRPTDNILVLTQYIEHLKSMEEYLIENYSDTHTIKEIYGSTKLKDREEIRLDMENSSSVILLGSFGTISAGWSAKKVHCICFLSSYKSQIKVLQSIGRGLRLHESKSYATLYDVCDDLRYRTSKGNIIENTLYKHWEQRKEYYDKNSFEYITEELIVDPL